LKNIIEKIVSDAIEEINIDLEIEELNSISNDTKLFDLLDSLGTLDLVIELESRLQQEFGRYIQVANDTTMDKDKTDFDTYQSLVEYLIKKVS
jgi:acyl carrier protein